MPSSSSFRLDTAAARDAGLVEFVRSIVGAAQAGWPDRFVTDFNAKGSPRRLYTETHYALAAVLLTMTGRRDPALLDLAASRLRMWSDANGDKNFFNALAYCLTAIVLRNAGEEHAPLREILTHLLATTVEDPRYGYGLECGNNAYLQQMAVATVLLPLARQGAVSEEGVSGLIREFRKYRTPEGFFYDLPRERAAHELLCPPTYVMKMLFLVGVCHELHPAPELAEMFRSGMASALPLLSREGHFSYFGRTDNSPFEAGLTIFNLRKAARIAPDMCGVYDEVCARTERFYRTFPRTPEGMLRANRFADAASSAELVRSRDDYAYDGQYSLASAAYALLACHWFPQAEPGRSAGVRPAAGMTVATSLDLGLARVRGHNLELIVRTTSQVAREDRRYLGPTILRYEVNGRLAVGAISRTLSSDRGARPLATSRLGRVSGLLRHWRHEGIEQLDGTSVGFLPVIRSGSVDYLPCSIIDQDVSPSRLRMRYRMMRIRPRGLRYSAGKALALIVASIEGRLRKQRREPGQQDQKAKPYRPLPVGSVDSLELTRDIYLEPQRCRIEDRLSGNLAGKTLLFSVRYMPDAHVRVRGLTKRTSMTGWGSDGRQTVDLYEAPLAASEIRYECDIEPAARPSI